MDMDEKEKKHQDDLFERFMKDLSEERQWEKTDCTVKSKTAEKDSLEGQQRKKPYEYDFKYLMKDYYEYYQGEKYYKTMTENYEEIEGNENALENLDDDNVTRWYFYRWCFNKTSDERKGKPFDCDSWNGTNDLADKIYDVLWRNDAWKIKNVKGNLKPDTMNSFATTFDALAGTAERRKGGSKKAYEDYKINRDKYAVLQGYAHCVGCLGNFVLVPKGYNGFRGMSEKLRDYWDLSLQNLKVNGDAQDWLLKSNISFAKYINMFFLWDYIEDNNVVPLFPSHRGLLSPYDVCPHEYEAREAIDEFQIFTENVNNRIRRRGMFMTSMLKIAKDNEADYKRLVGVLASDKVLGTMEKVVKNMLEEHKKASNSDLKLEEETVNELKKLQKKLKKESLKTL